MVGRKLWTVAAVGSGQRWAVGYWLRYFPQIQVNTNRGLEFDDFQISAEHLEDVAYRPPINEHHIRILECLSANIQNPFQIRKYRHFVKLSPVGRPDKKIHEPNLKVT